jgi:hypothetical protein
VAFITGDDREDRTADGARADRAAGAHAPLRPRATTMPAAARLVWTSIKIVFPES